MNIKKFIIGFALMSFACCNCVDASTFGYKYIDGSAIYADVTIPFDTANAINNDGKKVDLTNLKRGKATKTNVLGLVEWGNAGIYNAAKEGNIKKIYYAEVTKEKVFIPLIFIPIYFNNFTTTVYGE